MSSKKSKGYWQEKNEVMTYYNTIEPSYELQYSEEQDKKYDIALQTLDFIDHEKIIDVGCGTGLLFSKIKKSSVTIVGVDVSMNLLNRAIKRGVKPIDLAVRLFHLLGFETDLGIDIPTKSVQYFLYFGLTHLGTLGTGAQPPLTRTCFPFLTDVAFTLMSFSEKGAFFVNVNVGISPSRSFSPSNGPV